MTSSRPPKVSVVARAALEQAKGDVHAAAKILAVDVRQNIDLFDELMDPLVDQACLAAVSQAHRQERKSVWQTEQRVSKGADGIRLMAASNLSDFPLPDGTKLGDAMRGQVEEAAGMYLKQSEDMGHKARWLRLIAQSLPADRKVADVMTDERLRELQTEARNG